MASTPSRVIPVVVYEDMAAAHDFLVDAFGFEPGGVQRDGSGDPVHAEVRTRDGAIWLHAVSSSHDLASARSLSVATGGLVVHVDDVDEHFRHASESGATIDSEPTDQEYGQREYGARDPEGHRWWFATPTRTP
jgi:uncharacterized glyoxalase superfamily protein PhnB